MSTVVEAVYENGMLKLAQPLSLPEGMRVRVTITPTDEDYDPLARALADRVAWNEGYNAD